MQNKTFIFGLAAAIMLVSACSETAKNPEADEKPDELLSHIDSSYKPGDDFFMFANNGWFKSHPIPASEYYNGIFKTIHDTVNQSIRKICESAAKDEHAEIGSHKQKIGDYYYSGMDTVTIEKAGLAPLADELKMIDDIKDINGFMQVVAHHQSIGVPSLFSFYINADDKISTKNTIFTWQGGLGLPERDYYFNNDTRTANIRNEYVKHIAKMFELAGTDAATAEKNSKAIMQIETALAKQSRKLADLRDPYKNYNKMPVSGLGKLMPSVFWPPFFEAAGLKNADTVVVGQPEFFKEAERLLKSKSMDDWKTYLKWNLLNNYANYLNKAFVDQNFYFYGTILSGTQEQKPRWKKIVEQTDNDLGELIGQVYINEYLPKGTKEKLMEIGNNIRTVYADHIRKLDWMSDSTKAKALSKLNKIIMKVGYPDKFKDMSALEISRSSYVQNVINVNKWQFNYMIQKFGKPVDRTEWTMQPQTYNAYYNPTNNEIVVPACNIIVPGYDMADDALLYGIIGGSTFGHELTHGFDDQGSQYDENGNLSDWWTKEDKEKFEARTKLIVEQFNDYRVLDSMHVNGAATQGENIADLGGLVMGYEAFKKTKQGQSTEKIAGMTPDQRFFLGYGYAWMLNIRPERLATLVMTDVHAPARYRILGPVSNMPEFYAAFGIKEGDAMYRPDSLRVKIW